MTFLKSEWCRNLRDTAADKLLALPVDDPGLEPEPLMSPGLL